MIPTFNPFSSTGGEMAHWMHKKNREMGIYTPREGFYKIVEITHSPIIANSGRYLDSNTFTNSASKVKTFNGDDRVIYMPIYTHYDSVSFNHFNNEVVLIEGIPLFNASSNGPKDANLKVGDIIHVKNSILSNKTYAIDWMII